MASVLVTMMPPRCKCQRFFLKIPCFGKRIKFKSLCTKAPSSESSGKVEIDLGNMKFLTIESGKFARLADGCATATYRNTTVLATVVSKEKREYDSFVPLTVSYKQKAAALGRIPLNFLRRETGQNEHEILTSRMIDRSIRPLFPVQFSWDTQIICNPLAIDGSNFPDVLGINAASAALAVSDVPWNGPIGAVRVGMIDGEPIVNPTKLELKESQINIMVAAQGSKKVIMLDGSASNVLLSDLNKCLKYGVKECQSIVNGIITLRSAVGKPKRKFEEIYYDPDLVSQVKSLSEEKLKTIFRDYSLQKLSRDEEISKLRKEVVREFEGNSSVEAETLNNIFGCVCKTVFRDLIFEDEIRCDGRKLEELRNIRCETNLYEPLHGSALFQRGQTQVLCTVALDSPNSSLKMDKNTMLISGIKEKNFLVHYEFPPFATKDTGRIGPIGRREIGHGALAEKALQANVPKDFPFTIRLTSEVLESNGSSSMATVCGGSLALMDAGVPIDNPCAGVALGFVSRRNDQNEIIDYKILTDILGIEDYLGEMDFKVAGTKTAFTACQLDVKNDGIPLNIVYEILMQSKKPIRNILKVMKQACPEVRLEKKSNFPETQTVKVPAHQRSSFLGPGGLNIKKLEAVIGVEITETSIGEFLVFAANKEAMKEANEMIEELLKSSAPVTLEFGAIYSVIVTELKESGCMVSLHPNLKPVFIHVSQLGIRKVAHPSALGLQVGDEIKVKYFGRDPISGAIRLSRKVLLGPVSEVVRSLNRSSVGSSDSESVAS